MSDLTKLSISMGEYSFTLEGNQEFVEKNSEYYLTLLRGYISPSAQQMSVRDQAALSTGNPRLVDFVKSKNPKQTATELMPVLAYYSKKYEGNIEFNESSMKKLFARYNPKQAPKRVAQAFADISRNQGYFTKVKGKKGVYELSDLGEYLVESELPRN